MLKALGLASILPLLFATVLVVAHVSNGSAQDNVDANYTAAVWSQENEGD